MKIFFTFLVALTIVLHVTAFNLPFSKLRSSTRHYANEKDVFAALEERLQARLKQNQVQVEVVSDSTAKQGTTASKTAVKKEAVKSAAVTKQQAPAEKKQQQQQTQTTQKVAPPPPPTPVVKQEQKQVQQVAASQVVTSENKITSLEVFEGIGLGTLPFILVPVVLFNSVKGLLPKPQPAASKAPAAAPVKAKVQTYTKSLAEGAKEGYAELASGKSTPELDDTRRAYKIVGASFAVAIATAAFSLLFNGGNNNEVAVAPKVENKVVQVAPKKVEVAKPKAQTAAPAPVAAPVKVEAKKADVKPAAPTPTQSVTEEKKVVEKKQEEKPVVKSEEVKPAAKTEEAKPTTTTTTNTEEAKPVKAEVKPATPEPVQQKVETKVAEKVEKVEEKAAAVSKPVETTAKPVEKKVESTPAPTPTPVAEKKVEAEKPKPVPTPSKAATSTTAKSPSATSEKPESKVPQIEVVNVRGDSKRVVQQLQPDVVDLSKFQSLRNKN
eukprot:gene7541-8143_t